MIFNDLDASQRRFEFVAGADILWHLGKTPSAYERVVGTAELFGVQVSTLKDLSILDELALAEKYAFVRDGKKTLNDIAYLNYRRQLLTPIQLQADVDASTADAPTADAPTAAELG